MPGCKRKGRCCGHCKTCGRRERASSVVVCKPRQHSTLFGGNVSSLSFRSFCVALDVPCRNVHDQNHHGQLALGLLHTMTTNSCCALVPQLFFSGQSIFLFGKCCVLALGGPSAFAGWGFESLVQCREHAISVAVRKNISVFTIAKKSYKLHATLHGPHAPHTAHQAAQHHIQSTQSSSPVVSSFC